MDSKNRTIISRGEQTEGGEIMFYGNRKTRIVHFQQCHYTDKIDDSRIEFFYSLEEAKAHGYRLCKCCNPIGSVALRSKELKTFCAEKDIRCYPEKGQLLIMTQLSEWKINVGTGRALQLFHKNSIGDRNGYHKQALHTNDLSISLQIVLKDDR